MPIIFSHILDSVKGCDAAGIRVRCQRLAPCAEPQLDAEIQADNDGRIVIEIDTHHDESGTCYEVVFSVENNSRLDRRTMKYQP